MKENNQGDQSEKKPMDHFDRQIGALHGLPDVAQTKASLIRVVPTFGIGTQTYMIQTFRQREKGDTIFLEQVSENGTVRLVIPSAVADTIARQRASLVKKTRSKAMKAIMEDRIANGFVPSFGRK